MSGSAWTLRRPAAASSSSSAKAPRMRAPGPGLPGARPTLSLCVFVCVLVCLRSYVWIQFGRQDEALPRGGTHDLTTSVYFVCARDCQLFRVHGFRDTEHSGRRRQRDRETAQGMTRHGRRSGQHGPGSAQYGQRDRLGWGTTAGRRG